MNQEGIHNVNRAITRNKIESVVKKRKSPWKKSSTVQLNWGKQANIQRTYTDSSQMLPKDWRGRNTPKDIL